MFEIDHIFFYMYDFFLQWSLIVYIVLLMRSHDDLTLECKERLLSWKLSQGMVDELNFILIVG